MPSSVCPAWRRLGRCAWEHDITHSTCWSHPRSLPRDPFIPTVVCPEWDRTGQCSRTDPYGIHTSLMAHPLDLSSQLSPSSSRQHSSSHSRSSSRQPRPLCKRWTQGQCTGRGCLDRHYYEDSDQSQRLATSPRDGGGENKVIFTSPYHGFKVVKEVERIRREEVDLETGKRKSFVEEKEYEVLELRKERSPFAPVSGNTINNKMNPRASIFKFPEARMAVAYVDQGSESEAAVMDDSVIIIDYPEVAVDKRRKDSSSRTRHPSLR